MAGSKNSYEYFAFISYKREDEKWAKWLQKKLEYYKLPSSVRKDNPDLPEKIRPVFKDTTDLEPGVLAQKIQNALNSSKFLIVICSPRSANSVWVSKEVQSFIDSGRADHIIPFIIGGTPNAANPKDECFPEGLRQLAGEKELLGANINEMGREAAAIKVVARMFNLRFDTLWQRFEKEKHRRIFCFGLIAIIIVILSLVVVGYITRQNVMLSDANEKIIAERDRANQERNRAELANRNLETANDSIKYQSKLLTLSKDSLSIINNMLTATVRNLYIERNNVVLKSHELQKEQLRLISNQAELLFEEGNVLRSYHLIRPMAIEVINHRYPYSPEIASLINKIKWYLNEQGYKVVERLIASDNDSVYVSPNLLYNPYTERGKFYLRDIKKGSTIVLPGEDRIDDCDIQFGKNILYYRGIGNSYMWNIIQEEKIDLPDSFNSMDYEDFMNYTLPDLVYPTTNHFHSYNDIPDINDYNIAHIVEKERKYIISPDNNEILVNDQLLSKRILPISFDSGIIKFSICSEKDVFPEPDSIVYNNLIWFKIDEKGPLRLYQRREEDGKLLLKNDRNHSFVEFTPFVAYSMGNGIGYLETAFILNEDEILCVSGQTNHEIYNTKLNTRTVFQSRTIDGWKMGHVGLYLANAFLLDENTLCDVRTNGQITVYDIPSRLIIDEYDIPIRGWLKDGEWLERVFLEDNRIVIIYKDCSYEIVLAEKLQSLSEDILLIDQFWN